MSVSVESRETSNRMLSKRIFRKKAVRKLIGGVRRYGLLRAGTGLARLLKYKMSKPTTVSVSTLTEHLDISFDYPDQFIGTLVVFREFVEPEYRFLQKALSRDSVFFDVGGGIGNYSLCAAKLVGGPVHTFEPMAANIRTIQRNLDANGLSPKVWLNPVALSNIEGFGLMEKPEAIADLFGRSLTTLAPTQFSGSVRVTTIDSYCEKNRISSIDIMKIDVEGHEAEAMAGAEGMLSRNAIGVIILEADHRLETFYNSLQDRGFLFFYYNYTSGSLKRLNPVSEKTIREAEPSVFSSNLILIHSEKMKLYSEKFRLD
jgi:FkbM family methyltransferase